MAEEGGCDASELDGRAVEGLRVAEAAAEEGGKVAVHWCPRRTGGSSCVGEGAPGAHPTEY